MRRTLLLAGGVLVAAAACTDNRANSMDPVGAAAYGVTQIPQATNVPRGTASFAARLKPGAPTIDSIAFSLAGIDTLENGFYTVWVAGSNSTSFKRAPGTLRVTRTDTVFNTFGDPVESSNTTLIGNNISAFSNGGPRNRYLFSTTRAQAGLLASDSMRVILVTIENSATAASPSPTRRPIWARRSEGAFLTDTNFASVVSSPIRFGNFAVSPDSDYRYVGGGRGRVQFRDRLLQLEDSSLARPPLGFYYAVYGITRNDSTNAVKDTVYLGALRSSYPNRDALSLFNADSLIVDAAVQTTVPPAILASSIRARTDTVAKLKANSFHGLAQILLVLESKNKTEGRLGVSTILTSDVPGIVRIPPK